MVEHKTNKKSKNKPLPNPVGRPPIYNNVEELEAKILQYFTDGYRKKMIKVRLGRNEYEYQEVPFITITGLVLYLGFCDRASFYDYEKKPEFSYSLRKARTFIEQEYEELLRENPTAAIFALKQFSWRETQYLDQTVNEYLHDDLKEETVENLQARLDILREQNR